MTHELYKPSDFTSEEYQRGNILAVAVIKGKARLCKKCHREGAQLDKPCQRSSHPPLTIPTLSAEQFEALEKWVEAVAERVVAQQTGTVNGELWREGHVKEELLKTLGLK